MTRRHTLFESPRSLAGGFFVGLGLHGAAFRSSHFFCVIAKEALGLLPSVLLAARQASQACAFDHHWLLECWLDLLVSFCWRLLAIVGVK